MKNINKWDSLSIKDKADLMKLYIKNGISNLEEIRSHYNKFVTGGYTEGNEEQNKELDIIEKEVKERNDFAKKVADYYKTDTTRQKAAITTLNHRTNLSRYKQDRNYALDWYTKRSQTNPELVSQQQLEKTKELISTIGVTNASKILKSPYPAFVPEELKQDYDNAYGRETYRQAKHLMNNPGSGAVYSIGSHTIVENDLPNRHNSTSHPNYNAEYPWDTMFLHEIIHGVPLYLQQVRDVMNKHGIKDKGYTDSAEEIYSRLFQTRDLYNLDPNKKYILEDIQELKKRGTTFETGLDILNRYPDEFILDLFNLTALNNSNNDNYANYAKLGGKLNKFSEGGEKNTIDSRHAKLLARRRMPGDIEALRAAGYDKYGNPIVVFGGGSFGRGGAGAEFTTDNIKSEDYDYIRNTPLLHSFSDAFNNARKAGKNTFIFNGKEYTTEISDNPKYVGKQYEPMLNIREVLDKNMKVIPDSTKIEPYLGQIPGTSKREYDDGGNLVLKDTSPTYNNWQEAINDSWYKPVYDNMWVGTIPYKSMYQNKDATTKLSKNTTIDNFINVMYPIVEQSMISKGKSLKNVDNMVKQIAYESNYGRSSRGNGYNLAGIKEFDSSKPRTKYKDGQYYKNFNDYRDFTDYYVDLVTNRYEVENADNLKDYVDRLHGKNSSGKSYSTNKNYYRDMKNMKTLDKKIKNYKK